MNCASMQEMLSARLDGELSPELCESIDAHVATCSSCREQIHALQQLNQQLQSTLKPSPDQSRQLIDAVAGSLLLRPMQAKSHFWRSAAIAITAAAAGFLLAAWMLPKWQQAENPIDGKIAKKDNPQQAQPPATQDLQVQLAFAIGVVEVEEQGTWKPLATGANLQAGQHIRTLERSRCELHCMDGSEIRLNYDSDLIVQSPRFLRLKRGQVWSTVAKDPTPYQIRTDQSIVTALGTRFDLACRDQQTTLTVLEGKTRMELAGRTAEVSAGQQLRMDDKQGTYDIRDPDYALYQATNWVNEILVLKGRDNPELVSRIDELMAKIGETKMGYLAEEEIRTLGDHCVVPLCKFLQSPRSKGMIERRQMAARIVSDLAQPRSIGDLIELLSDSDGLVRSSVARALHRLTKRTNDITIQHWQNFDPQAAKIHQAQWRDWWTKNRNRYPDA